MKLIQKVEKVNPIFPLKQQLQKESKQKQFESFYQPNQNPNYDTCGSQLNQTQTLSKSKKIVKKFI